MPEPNGLGGAEVRGSGKSETPCWRMHRAMLRNLASVCGEGGGPEPGPAGMSLRHFACAALNAGDLGSIQRARTGKPPLAFGSGKLGTPLERMHLAKAITACWRLAGLSGDEPPLSELADEAPFAEERWATPGLEEPAAAGERQRDAQEGCGGEQARSRRGEPSWCGCCAASGLLRVCCGGFASSSRIGSTRWVVSALFRSPRPAAVLFDRAGETALKHRGATLTTRSYRCGCL